MEKISEWLTDYVIDSGLVRQENREAYQYGFLTGLELLLSVIVCVVITVPLKTGFGGILFFAIFIPLRSFAGGLHLNHYLTCLILSCLTYLAVLLAAKYSVIDLNLSVLLSICLMIAIRLLYPVEHSNRPVDESENRRFLYCLNRFLIVDSCILVCVAFFKKMFCVRVILYTLLLIVTTMLIGKMHASKENHPEK